MKTQLSNGNKLIANEKKYWKLQTKPKKKIPTKQKKTILTVYDVCKF